MQNGHDFGDAPEGALAYPVTGIIGQFPTCKTVGPAGWVQHTNFGAWLGPSFDLEADGNAGLCPGFNPYDADECFADGDAGLLTPPPWTIQGAAVVPCPNSPGGGSLGQPCQMAMWGPNIDVDVHNHMPNQTIGYVNVLMDWDQNGMWAGASQCPVGGAPEHVLADFPIPNPFDGPLSMLMPPGFLIGPNTGPVWVRISITERPVGYGWDGSGAFEDGETEDYLLLVRQEQPEELDFGDAPDPTYPTLRASNGASHLIVAGMFLGAQIDAEADGQPNANATGDDLANLADEDGVTLLTPLQVGQMAQLLVTASVAGRLDAWIDFNANGSWADPGEQVFFSTPLVGGVNALLVAVPAGAVPGPTFARFRYSSAGGLSFVGQAPDGEVEDYQFIIEEAPPTDDFGDAPDPAYPTLLASNGARHTIVQGFMLGNLIDAERDGQPNANATGDDLANLPDEDGVAFVTPLRPGQPATISVTAAGPAAGMYLSAWIDFNNDGSWATPGDQIFVAQGIVPGVQNLTFVVPNTATPNVLTFARFRLHTNPGGVPFTGPVQGGEVEDYQVQIEEPEYDFGDAPDPTYPTLLASNGARHIIGSGLMLGNLVDGEPDGQPNATATGDDLAGLPDEDGVKFNTAIFGGVPNTITVTVTDPLGAGGYLNAWIDLNGDGDWSDAGEQVITDLLLPSGTYPVTFTVPSLTAVSPNTFARFRLSTRAGLSFTGAAPDGEVEDYMIQVVPVKWIQPPDLSTQGVDVNLYQFQLADDFLCTQSGPITDIHLWTSFYYDGVPEMLNGVTFTLEIYSDVPAGPENPYSHPGFLLWSRTYPPFTYNAGLCQAGISEWWHSPPDIWLPNNDHACYQYDFYIPEAEAFRQREGTVYWLSVKVAPGPLFADIGWKTSSSHWNDDACWLDTGPDTPTWRELRYGDRHPMAGESMDLAFAITGVPGPVPEPDDFGDAPAPYPTLLANNGAHHTAIPGLSLGNLIDTEADGLPNATATGDDANNLADEDGVTFNTAFFAGVPNTLTVTTSMPPGMTAYLNAWIDFNGDGDWADPGEQIFTDWIVNNGANNLTFTPPVITALGKTFARFRLSTVRGLSYTGAAPDGEVEDYQVNIVSAKWLQRPDLTATGVDVDNHFVQLADDFRCTQTGAIRDIHIWTSFYGDVLPPAVNGLTFTLYIYSDVPIGPGNPYPYSHPGTLLWSRTFQPGTYRAGLCANVHGEWWFDPVQNFWHFPGDTQVYQYDFYINEEEAFRQTKGTIYWLGVKYNADMTDFTMGWKSTREHWNDDACWLDTGSGTPIWRELRYGDGHPLAPDSMDLAFALTGKACPRPQQDSEPDGDVDLADFSVFQSCFNGPNRPWKGPPPPTQVCACFDDDDDGDVDLADFSAFQACFNGPNRPPKPGC
ncbi:MAG: GEVED domain-containing protein [Phycisphaerae bacterium]